jgi:hypothetical protein
MSWPRSTKRRPSPEHIKRNGWREQNILVVSANDERLNWAEREFVRRLGKKLYGQTQAEVRRG